MLRHVMSFFRIKYYPIALVLFAFYLYPADARAGDKKLFSWKGSQDQFVRLKGALRQNDRRKFSMPLGPSQRRSLLSSKINLRSKTAHQANPVHDPHLVQQSNTKPAPQASLASQYQRVADYRARIKKYSKAARRFKEQAKKCLEVHDLKGYRRYLGLSKRVDIRSLELRGELYTILGVIKREEEYRKKRIAQSLRNFNRDINRHQIQVGNSLNKVSDHRQLQVLKTKIRVLASKIEMLHAQANIARIEGDAAGAREMHTEASDLARQINSLKNEINQFATSSSMRLASASGITPVQAMQQRALNKFRERHVTADLQSGKIANAQELLKKYEPFAGDSI